MTVNEKLRNTTIRHSVYMEQLKNNEVKKIIALLNKTDVDLRKQLLKRKGVTPTITSKRLELMKKDVAEIIADAKQIYTNSLTKTATGVVQSELKFTNNLIKNAIPNEVPISFIQPAPSQILGAIKATPFANTTTQGMIADWARSKTNTFTNAIQQAYVQGKSIDDVASILFGSKAFNYTNGLVDASRRQVRTQVRTAINHFASTSREIIYAENQDIIKGIQWVSTLDGSTTLLCMNLDGKVDYSDGSKNELNGQRPPAHFNCRSTTVPVIKSLKEMGLSDKEFSKGTRASMNGQVPETETYKTWFAKQDETFQKKTLGTGKYELYKNGGYTLDKFVDNGQTLSLKQLNVLDNPQNPAGSFAKFVPAKNIKDAEEFARQNFITAPDFSMVDLGTANSFNNGISNVFEKVPELKNYSKSYEIIKSNSKSAYAYNQLYSTRPDVTKWDYVLRQRFGISNTSYSDLTKSIQSDVLQGWTFKGFTPEHISAHEMGHKIANDIAIKGMGLGNEKTFKTIMSVTDGLKKAKVEASIINETYAKIGIKRLSDEGKIIRKWYGGYATTSSAEFFAQAIADATTSKEPQRFSIELLKIVREKLK